jgi:hypothetical protein
LQLEQFDLEKPFLVVVLLTAQPLRIGIVLPPRVYHAPVRVAGFKVVLV